MSLNNSNEQGTNQAARDYVQKKAAAAAKKGAKKAGGKTAKFAGGIVKKVVLWLVGIMGVPMSLAILVIAVLMFALPSLITSVTYGTDSSFDPDSLTSASVGSTWEDDAEAAINERFNELKRAAFWDDMATFFSSGQWGTSEEVFKTEFANAEAADMEGTEGYFSTSNRLIAIINEAYRVSLTDGKIVPRARALAERAVPRIEQEIRNSAEYGRPADVAEEDYHIIINVEQDPNYNPEDMNFIYESCYMLAAASGMSNVEGNYDTGVRSLLDYVFAITGLDTGEDEEICWEPQTRAEYGSYNEETVILWWEAVDKSGVEKVYYNYDDIPDKTTITHVETKRVVTVTAYSYYSASMASDYQDVINEHFEIETELSEDAAAYEIPMIDQVRVSAIELAKFYSAIGGDWGSVGEAGLPLPVGSYYISSPFGYRVYDGVTEFHKGIDMSAAMGTPVYATKAGVCSVPGMHSSYGNYVTIDHGEGLTSRYAHMSSVVVADGQVVEAGEIIGFVGSTGNSSGPHLHFEIRINDNPINPMNTELGDVIQNSQRK